jgi:murein DD-endopeptidase MepM/ murein hydrolase activator NlpD
LDLPSVVSGLEVFPLIWVEGETGRLRLTTTTPMTVTGTFLERPLAVVSDPNQSFHIALIGIPVFTAAGIYPLSLSLSESAGGQINLTLNIQIVSGNYGSESITLAGDQSDLLNPNIEVPEQNLLQSIMGKVTPTRYFDGPMGLPAAASVTSPFGLKRSYDGGPFDRFHAGTDFAGAPGSPVLAPASGYVVLSDNLHIRGNATILDHGWGVFTGYWHQTEQYIQVGDFVAAGQVIGTIGSTGRVTGPHLHWELWVGGAAVDPMQWVLQSFA